MTERVHVELELKELAVHYGSRLAFCCDSLLASGSIIAVIGHNGAGKSTLIKSVLGLAPPHTGTMRLSYSQGGHTSALTPHKNMAFCPEYGAVFEDIDVESYIKFWCRVKCGDGLYYRKQGSKFIDALDLTELLPRLGRELSKGERRRVQTAIGYLTRPKLFLFDEPFCGLDIYQARVLQDVFTDNVSETALFISSHRMEIVERLADFIIVLDNGGVAAAGDRNSIVPLLCGSSFTIKNISSFPKLVQALKTEFASAHLQVGVSEIQIVGPLIDKTGLQQLVSTIDGNGAVVSEFSPRLTEALQFFLRRS